MMPPTSVEGRVPYSVPAAGKDCFTWYKTFGSLDGPAIPLIALHGGPGSPHNYLLALADLTEHYGIPVILYDQLGCGNSTHLPEKRGDKKFFNSELYERELDNIVEHLGLSQFHLLGHSWGGMLAAKYAATSSTTKLRKLIIMNSPSSMDLFLEGVNHRLSQLPQSIQDTIQRHKQSGDFGSPEYIDAMAVFYNTFWCRLERPWPTDLSASREIRKLEPSVVLTMYGPTEFQCTGSIRDWTAVSWAHEIKSPTLLLTGEFDEVIDVGYALWLEKIPGIKWVNVDNASHMMMWERREHIMRLVSDFIDYKS